MRAAEWYMARAAGQGLRKAVDESSWSSLLENHSPTSEDVVDPSGHIASSSLPNPVAKLIESPDPVKPAVSVEGSSPKVVLDFSKFIDRKDPANYYHSGTMMMKPYHQATSMGYNLPIYGWSSMATKGAFESAGLGHMVEDVRAGKYNGTPVTYHIFAPNDYQTEGQLRRDGIKYSPDPADVGKIAIMDYLTGNLDRHGANILVGGYDPETKSNRLLAIDHELNFQYATSMGKHVHKTDALHDIPGHYLRFSSLGRMTDKQHDKASLDKIAAWWNKHSKQVRAAVSSHASAIRDEHVRNHVVGNFSARADAMDKWANAPDDTLFSDQFAPVTIAPFRMKFAAENRIKEMIKDKEPPVAVRAIARVLRDNPKMSLAMSDTVRQLAPALSPAQIADVLVDNRMNKGWDAASDLLWVQPREKMLQVVQEIHDRAGKFSDLDRTMPFVATVMDMLRSGQDVSADKTEAA